MPTDSFDAELRDCIAANVQAALAEDVGPGDLTAGLVPAGQSATARVIARESAVIAGQAWFDAVFAALDDTVAVQWRTDDGEIVAADGLVCTITGPARAILTGERSALNFLQCLSATATLTAKYVAAVSGTPVTILDTRKTLPGLRLAQKYAVRCGGGENHRTGLYDAILIKENHISATGSIAAAIGEAREQGHDVMVEVEVENHDQLDEALNAGCDRILLDNFSSGAMRDAVKLRDKIAPDIGLEASGNITLDNIRTVAETGIDFISIGALTKNISAIDLSMRFEFGVT